MAAAAAARFSATPDPFDVLPAILVVEDDVLVRLHVADHLRSRGFRVYEAASAEEALDIATVKPLIDLVFSDVSLPGGLDGFALAKRIWEERPRLPIVFGSGHASPDAAAALGGDARVFGKPYDLDELVVHFRSVIKARQAH